MTWVTMKVKRELATKRQVVRMKVARPVIRLRLERVTKLSCRNYEARCFNVHTREPVNVRRWIFIISTPARIWRHVDSDFIYLESCMLPTGTLD